MKPGENPYWWALKTTFLYWVLVLDIILLNDVLGRATLWWIHQAMEYWYLMHLTSGL
jgi:hypothetical protein